MLICLNRADLANVIHENSTLNKGQSAKVVDAILEEMDKALLKGDPVKFVGHFSIHPKIRAKRKGRNPKTGDVIPIAESIGLKIHISNQLKAKLKKNKAKIKKTLK